MIATAKRRPACQPNSKRCRRLPSGGNAALCHRVTHVTRVTRDVTVRGHLTRCISRGRSGRTSGRSTSDLGAKHAHCCDGTSYPEQAYQNAEASTPGNRILIHTTELSREGDSLRWSYEASYHAADLLHYTPYAYRSASAPLVQITATELYAVGGNTLSVQANATGQDDTGQSVGISLTGSLNLGTPVLLTSSPR